MKNSEKKIVIIGAGKVASVLAPALNKRNKVVQVYSRKSVSAKRLANKLDCGYTNHLSKIESKADVYIIAIKDDAIESVAKHLHLGNKLLVHTSGSVSIDVLKTASKEYGIFYPLQTFSNTSKLKQGVPFCIEASGKKARVEIEGLVKNLSGKPYYLNSAQRAKLHLAAVFANNFTNHMFVIANEITDEAKIPFDILLPLIEETADKIKTEKPALVQTGPAVRNDKKTLKRHKKLLKGNHDQLKLYKDITKSIQAKAK